MRSTIRDVAKLAGVSIATVSLVINKKDSAISPKTRSNVLEAVKALNYRPNQLAVSLATNRSKFIAVIVPVIANPFFAQMASYFDRNAKNLGYSVMISNVNDDAVQTCDALRFFADHCVDGIVIAQTDFQTAMETQRVLKTIEELQVPLVTVDRVMCKSSLPSVSVDQFESGYLATLHLLEHGHRRIGCITGPLGIHSAKERLRGYQTALQEYNISINPSWIYEGQYCIQTGAASVPILLGEKCTGVVCCSDTLAFGVYKELRNLNRKIPDDMSVVSIDDTVLADVIQPALTSVSQPLNQLTINALDLLLDSIGDPNKHQNASIRYHPQLKVRASVRHMPN